MRSLLIFSMFLWGMQGYAFAAIDDLTADDITKSMTRVKQAFHTNLQKNSLLEKEVAVGEISQEKSEFYITFRPSLGTEFFNCIDKTPLPLEKIGLNLSGAGHKGLTQLFSKENIEKNIITPFMEYKNKNQIPTEQLTVFVEGMSAGAHRAVETALYLKQHADTKNHKINILRYAGAKSFDDVAACHINNSLGHNNIIEFNAMGDEIAAFLNMPAATTSLGNQILFSAEDSIGYKTRVDTMAYTCMDPILKSTVSWLQNPQLMNTALLCLASINLDLSIVDFLTPKLWEKHQPITYAELCPQAFDKFTKEPITK